MKKKNSIELMGVWRRLGTKAEILYSTTFSSSWSTPLGLSRPLSSASGNGQAEIMSGKPIAKDIRSRVAAEICRMKAATGRMPGLAVVLVGNRKDSHTYVHLKLKACNQVGIVTSIVQLPQDCTQARLIDVVSSFNRNPSVHGIIVQLPLPQHLDEEKIINFVSPEKDVDGFHPLNMGNLAMRGREPLFIPCAPKACIELLLRYGVEIIGKNAAVIGRSKIVGLSTSLLLQVTQIYVLCCITCFNKFQ
ncbi:hypothetical protein ABKV19_002347 [Rosa sericea]